jgi:formylglycine-generating enzyme required for sulfatase activity
MSRFFHSAVIVSLLASPVLANSAPIVSNVRVSQRNDDSKLVDIYYNLADIDNDAITIWINFSDDNGASWVVPAMTFTGDIGQGIGPGMNKHIIWDAGRDMPGRVGSYKARVYADDGKGPAEMRLVPGGWFGYQNAAVNNYMYLPTFLIGKYEVTNEQYCQFLNNGDPTSQHWISNMLITRTGPAGNYFYTVVVGKEKFPVFYVSWFDAEAYAVWLSAKTGQNYRLPTEQEWEKAAGWDPSLNRMFTYGFHQDVIDCTWCNYYTGSTYCYGGPLPIGSFNGAGGKKDARSFYGCYDMSGNLWEWTASWYTLNQTRVLRGGNWNINASECEATARSYNTPALRYNIIGFRLVLDSN